MLYREVVQDAVLRCSFGEIEATLKVTNNPHKRIVNNKLSATVKDHQPVENIPQFGRCIPLGKKCAPITRSEWVPGAKRVTVNNIRVLTENSTCACAIGGVISISKPNQERSRLESM